MSEHTPGPWEHHPAINYAGFSVAPKGILPTLAAVERPRGNPELCVVDCFNFPGSTEANARLIAASPSMEQALRAVLLFHSSSPWDAEKQRLWEEFTGTTEATTKILCDTIRVILESATGKDA